MNLNRIILISIFTVGVYAIIVLLSDTGTLYSKFVNLKYDTLLIAMGLFSLGYFIRSFRWITMLRNMGIKVPLKQNLLIYFTGYTFSLTPGKIGEAVRSKYLKDDFQIPISKTVPTVFSERYYDVIGIVVIALATYGLSGTQNVFVFLSIFLLVFLYFAVKKKIIERILFPLRKIGRFSKFYDKLIEISENVNALLKPKIFFVCSILTIISWGLEAIGAYFVFVSFDMDLGISYAAFVYVVSALVGAASFLPGGVGGTEGSLLGLLLLNGYDYNHALGPVLMIRIYALWYVIIIGIFFTFVYKLKYHHSK